MDITELAGNEMENKIIGFMQMHEAEILITNNWSPSAISGVDITSLIL
jgi:hypothetical protein